MFWPLEATVAHTKTQRSSILNAIHGLLSAHTLTIRNFKYFKLTSRKLYQFFYTFWRFFIPFKASSYICHTPILFFDGAFYVIGGNGATNQNVIGKLDATTMVWSKSGELVTGRYAHNSIFDGTNILVVGGDGTFKTEKCSLLNGQITCSEQNPELFEYRYYPELFMIPANFCKNWP